MNIKVPPTGRLTITLDWAAELAAPPRCGATLTAASWTLPTGFTEVANSESGSVATITFTTAGLRLGKKYTLVCNATLSNGDILTGGVAVEAAHRETTLSTAECP